VCVVLLLLAVASSQARATFPNLERIDHSLRAAEHYLLNQQSDDGAWRSRRYGLMKDGPSLTPHVALALRCLHDESSTAASVRAARYLDKLLSANSHVRDDIDLEYPVYTAAEACRLATSSRIVEIWATILHRQQLDESLGWHRDDPEFGGWSYALSPPHRPPPGRQRGPWDWSNLSATVDALETLHAIHSPTDDPSFAEALTFVRRCQNVDDDGSIRDPQFDDGGFFFTPAEAIRNKAGIAGRDAGGRARFRSYGSATADGIRALLLCGVPPVDSRVTAARRWLAMHFSADHNPGDFVPGNEDIRDATYFYYCRGVSRIDVDRDHAAALIDALITRQSEDGSWTNRFTDGREDDRLVATPMALEALMNLKSAFGSTPKPTAPPWDQK
jgi:squalene-hopene/tetraprenyl-beta-curcumene cyclase